MCKACIPKIPFDATKAESFAGKMVEIINHGALGAMISIGHRTNLFDVMSTLEASSSQEIASYAGLNERYVREWLAALSSGGVISFDPESNTFSLPQEHATFLIKKANEKNMSAIASMLPVWSSVEDQLVDCFFNGGGVPYQEYRRFHEVMGDLSQANAGANFVNIVLSEHQELTQKLNEGIRILDVGCGDGQVTISLAKEFPNSTFIGIDLCEGPISTAQLAAEKLGLQNIQFINKDILQYQPEYGFDLITAFDVIHDLAFPDQVLDRIKSWLADNAVFMMMDINASSELKNNLAHPFAPFLYTASTMHCMTVSLSQGGMGLGTVWGKELALEMLKKAGFAKMEVENFEHDIMNNYYFSYN